MARIRGHHGSMLPTEALQEQHKMDKKIPDPVDKP